MIVNPTQITIGGSGGDYQPTSEFAQASEVINQPGAVSSAFVYVIVPAELNDTNAPVEVLGLYGISRGGQLMTEADHVACLPCPPCCP